MCNILSFLLMIVYWKLLNISKALKFWILSFLNFLLGKNFFCLNKWVNLPALNLNASSHSSDSIGPYCGKISFTKWLISSHSSYSGPPVLFSNGSILEISKILVKNHGWGSFSEILPIAPKVVIRFQVSNKAKFLK